MTDPAGTVIAAVRELRPTLERRAGEIEQGRRLPLDLVAELRRAGLFRMLVPRNYGGLELDFPASVEILAELAAADGATGWTVMIGAETPQLLALLPRATFERIYSASPDVICGGAFAPRGAAEEEPGGYAATGRWSFASGCQHADWLFGNCVVPRTVPRAAPLAAPEGAPELRCMALPAASFEIHDTWHAAGLRGTGSHDISLGGQAGDDRVHVPHQHTFDLFGGQPSLEGPLFAAPLLQFSLHIGAVARGIAEGAWRDLCALAATNKQRLYARTALADSPLFQYRLGQAEADLQAARALLRERAAEYWRHAQSATLDPAYATRVLQTTGWVAETAARVVDTCYTAGGATALYESSPLQRRLRDIHALTQHASVQESVFQNAGAQHLGRTGGFVF